MSQKFLKPTVLFALPFLLMLAFVMFGVTPKASAQMVTSGDNEIMSVCGATPWSVQSDGKGHYRALGRVSCSSTRTAQVCLRRNVSWGRDVDITCRSQSVNGTLNLVTGYACHGLGRVTLWTIIRVDGKTYNGTKSVVTCLR